VHVHAAAAVHVHAAAAQNIHTRNKVMGNEQGVGNKGLGQGVVVGLQLVGGWPWAGAAQRSPCRPFPESWWAPVACSFLPSCAPSAAPRTLR